MSEQQMLRLDLDIILQSLNPSQLIIRLKSQIYKAPASPSPHKTLSFLRSQLILELAQISEKQSYPPSLKILRISANIYFLFGDRFTTQLEITISALLSSRGILYIVPSTNSTLDFSNPNFFDVYYLYFSAIFNWAGVMSIPITLPVYLAKQLAMQTSTPVPHPRSTITFPYNPRGIELPHPQNFDVIYSFNIPITFLWVLVRFDLLKVQALVSRHSELVRVQPQYYWTWLWTLFYPIFIKVQIISQISTKEFKCKSHIFSLKHSRI